MEYAAAIRMAVESGEGFDQVNAEAIADHHGVSVESVLAEIKDIRALFG